MESLEISESHDPAVQDRALLRVDRNPDEAGTSLTASDLRRFGWLKEVVEEPSNSVSYAEIDLRESEALVHWIGPET